MQRTSGWLAALALFAASHAVASPALDAGAKVLQEATASSVRPFATVDFGSEKNPDARSVLLTESKAVQLLPVVRKRLPAGLVAFMGTMDAEAKPSAKGTELVVVEGPDQFAIVRAARTDGVNHGLDTAAIVAELQQWHKEFGIDIQHAQTDTVVLRLASRPKDMAAFVQRVIAFCPDVLQLSPSPAALAKMYAREGMVALWWD